MNSARVRKRFDDPSRSRARADGVQARPHVGVLGVGDDEIRAPIGPGANAREFLVQSKHRLASTPLAGARLYIAVGKRSNAPIDFRFALKTRIR